MSEFYVPWIEYLAQRNVTVVVLFVMALTGVLWVVFAPEFKRRSPVLRGVPLRLYLVWGGVALFMVTLVWVTIRSWSELYAPNWGIIINQPLWYDELCSWAFARLPLDGIVEATAGDVHPPLWYVLEALSLRLFGKAPWAMRLPALLLGMVNVAMTYRLARLIYRECSMMLHSKLPLWAAVFLLASPVQLYYMQEARMYTLLQLSVLVALLGLYEDRLWVIGLGSVLALYTHNLALFYLIPIWGMAFWRLWGKPRSLNLVSTGAGVFLAYIPWASVTLAQAQDVGKGYWIHNVGVGGYLFPLYRMTIGSLGEKGDFFSQHAAVVAFALFGVIVWWLTKLPRRKGIELGGLFLGGPLLLAAVSVAWAEIYLERFWVGILPLWAILAVGGLAQVFERERRLRVPILAMLVLVLGLGVLWFDKGTSGTEMARMIERYTDEGDVFYHVNTGSYLQFAYHHPESQSFAWSGSGSLYQGLSEETQNVLNIPRLTVEEMLGREETFFVLYADNPLLTEREVRAYQEVREKTEIKVLASWRNAFSAVELWHVRNGRYGSAGFPSDKRERLRIAVTPCKAAVHWEEPEMPFPAQTGGS